MPDCIRPNRLNPFAGLRRLKSGVSASVAKFQPPWKPCSATPVIIVAIAIGPTSSAIAVPPDAAIDTQLARRDRPERRVAEVPQVDLPAGRRVRSRAGRQACPARSSRPPRLQPPTGRGSGRFALFPGPSGAFFLSVVLCVLRSPPPYLNARAMFAPVISTDSSSELVTAGTVPTSAASSISPTMMRIG